MSLLKGIFKVGVKRGSKAAKAAKIAKKTKNAKPSPEYIAAKKLKTNRLLKQGTGIASGASVYFMDAPDKKEKSVAKKVISRAKSASKKKLS